MNTQAGRRGDDHTDRPPRPPTGHTLVFETTDADVVSDLYAQQYTAMRMRISSPQLLLRVAQTQIGRARHDRTTAHMALEGHADPLEKVTIVGIREGTVRYSCGGSEATYGPGDTCFEVPPGREWAVHLDDFDCDALLLDQGLLDEVAGNDHETSTPVRLLSNRPHSDAAAGQLWRTCDAVGTLVADFDHALYPLVITSTSRLLAASVLSAFPHTVRLEPTIEDRRDGHTATLRRAIAYIESHPDQPLTAADIARAAYVSVRAVQIAFRRQLDTTPMAYLRRVRLDRAHRDLVAADPAQETVTAVAARWGYAQPSRFAADYRAAYGHHPHQTLRDTR